MHRFLAKIAFIVFLFAVIFGTALPFQEKVKDASRLQSSNILNQLIYSILFILSLFSLLNKKREIISIIKVEKFLSLFLLWCFISIAWSEFSFISFKRYFQLITIVMVSLAALLHCENSKNLLRCFQYIFLLYVILSLTSILFIPEAINQTSGAWRGLTSQKNQLGQASLACIIIGAMCFKISEGGKKVIPFAMISISFLLILGSKSITSCITLLMMISFWFLLEVFRFYRTNKMGILFVFIVAIYAIAIGILLFGFDSNFIGYQIDAIGKDSTLTGRTYLWSDIFAEAKMHIFLGCGYAGFWVIDSKKIIAIYEIYPFLPNNAHMGYLDILNETGTIGLMCVILIVATYFKHLIKHNESRLWIWFFISALIVNLTESTLFIARSLSGSMFIFSYLALFSDRINMLKTPDNLHNINTRLNSSAIRESKTESP